MCDMHRTLTAAERRGPRAPAKRAHLATPLAPGRAQEAALRVACLPQSTQKLPPKPTLLPKQRGVVLGATSWSFVPP